MIEIDGVELRTAAQWEKKHRHVKKGQLGKGVERTWRSPNGNTTAMFYNIEQTRPWAKKDVEAVNRRRRADAKAKREADECGRIEGAARAEQHRKDLLDCWGAHIVSLAVSTRLPASPVDLASVVNIDNKDDENIVLDIGDYPIVTDPVAPET